jgi:multidrug efflux pump subunit AcrB
MTRFFEGVRLQRRAVLFAFVVLLAMGASAGLRAPAAILPEVTFPRITVIADAGELPAEQMLRTVTRPLEASVRRVPGVRELRSTTARGSVEMNIDCTWNTPMDLTLQRVQASLDAVRGTLPAGTSVDARLMSPALFPVLAYSLSSPSRSLAELRDLALFRLQPELARLPGCAEVVVQGGRRYEARVTLDPGALQARGLTAAGVAAGVQRATQVESVGLLESNRELYLGLADDRPGDLAALAGVPIPLADGAHVPLSTLGTVTLGEAPEFARYRTGGVEAVHVNLLRQKTASTVTLAVSAKQWFHDHRRDLPPDVQVRIIYDQSLLVRDSIAGARDALLVGVLTEVLIVMLFLGSLRLGLTYALGLPGAIAMTLIALRFAGGSLDMMTLGGIAAAIGLVADDAIVVVEYLVHRTEVPLAAGLAELMPGMLASSGCTLAIFLPFVWLGGVAGAFFRVLALTMALMLTASLILCFTVVPQFVASAPEKSADSRLARIREGIGPLFGAGARALIRRPWAALLAIGVAAGLAATLSLSLGTGFLPEMDEGSLIFDYFMPPGTSPSETEKVLAGIEREMAATPEVAMYSGRIGDQLGFFITEPSRGDYVLVLKARRKRTGEEVAADLRERIATQWPMVRIEFGQLVEDNIGDLIAVPQPVEVKLFGEDRAVLEARAHQVAALLDGYPRRGRHRPGRGGERPQPHVRAHDRGAAPRARRRHAGGRPAARDRRHRRRRDRTRRARLAGARDAAARGGHRLRAARAPGPGRAGAHAPPRRGRHHARGHGRGGDRSRRPAHERLHHRPAGGPRHGLGDARGEARARRAAAAPAQHVAPLRRALRGAAGVVPAAAAGAARRRRRGDAGALAGVPHLARDARGDGGDAGLARRRVRGAPADGRDVQPLELRGRRSCWWGSWPRTRRSWCWLTWKA